MFITINPNSDVPIFTQIHDGIVTAIAHGTLTPGDRLDPVRRVATDFGINPATVKKAYDQLVADGLVETAGRSGSVILSGARNTDQRAQLRANLQHAVTLARAQGFSDADITHELTALLKELS